MSSFLARNARILLICLGILAIGVSNAAHAQANLSASFGDWHTFCDHGRKCDAYTYSGWESAQNPNQGHVFTISRHPTGGGWVMSITFDKVEPKLSLGLSVSVIRYGHDQAPIPAFSQDALALRGGRIGNGLAGTHALFLSGSSAEMVMDRLRLGDILDFEFGGCRDEFLHVGFSLAGITAALSWIDKVQGLAPGSIKIAHAAPVTEEGRFPNCGE